MPKKTLAVISVVLLATLWAYSLLFLEVRKVNKEIASIQHEINSEDEREAGLKLAGRGVNETTIDREYLKGLFVGKSGTVAFIEKIESIASESGVSVTISSLIVEPSTFADLEKILIKFNAEGSWQNMYQFMLRVDSLPAALEWNRYSLFKQAKEGNNLWTLSGDLSVLKEK
jgi:hypothetical protein